MQVFSEPEFLSTQVIEGPLDVHPSKTAIVVHYSMDARVLSESLETMGADAKDCQKIIQVKNLGPNTDITALAQIIVSQTQLIQSSRIPEVEQLLVYLRSRKQAKPGFQDEDIFSASSREIEMQFEGEVTEKANLVDIEVYLELLYEELPDKIRGTAMILQLARNPDNLLELSTSESLLLALTRVLRDDWKKSIQLSTNIIYIFFCFSTFSDFHGMLVHYKVGSLCMTVLGHELTRYQSLREDLEKTKKQDSAVRDNATNGATPKKVYEKARKKFLAVVKKQEMLLRVCLYFLLNLAETPFVEEKMKNKGIIQQLVQLLSRDNQDLQVLVVSFLKKLSIYAENKDEMAKEGVLGKVAKLLPCKNEILVNVTLRLLMNLSFDPMLRTEMVKLNLLPKLVTLLKCDIHQMFVLFILYHISMDEEGRAAFAYTDCVPMVMKLILGSDGPPEPEVVVLGINLSCHASLAQVMCKGPGLRLLMKQALLTSNCLLMKMIRNISQHPGPTKSLFLEYLGDMGQVLRTGTDDEMMVEVMGILGNMNIPNLDYYRLLTKLKLVPLIMDKIKDITTRDDIVMECIIVCGTVSSNSKAAQLLVEANIHHHLINLLKVKQEDDEMVLQIVYLFHQLLIHPANRDPIIKKSETPDYLIELMNDKNKEVSKLCSRVLDIIADHDEKFGERIKMERFHFYNRQWVEMVTGEALYEDVEEDDEDYMDPYYLHTANELFSPEAFYDHEAGDGMERAAYGMERAAYGIERAVFPNQAPPSSPYDYDDPLEAYGVSLHSPLVEEELEDYGAYQHNPLHMGEIPDYAEHPMFRMVQRPQDTSIQPRPPSRMNF